jgi:hypothetical protein
MDMTYYRFNQEKQARLSFLIGLASVFAVVFRTGLTAYFIAPLGIIIGLLSRGADPALPRQARFGVILGVIALVANTLVLGITVVQFTRMLSDPVQRDILNETFYKQTGLTLDDLMQRAGNLIR